MEWSKFDACMTPTSDYKRLDSGELNFNFGELNSSKTFCQSY